MHEMHIRPRRAMLALAAAFAFAACGDGGPSDPGADPSRPAAVERVEGHDQSAYPGTAVDTAPAVRVTNAQGAPLAGVQVVFAAAGAGHGAVTGATQATDANGVARVGSWTVGAESGADTITAAVVGLQPLPFRALADLCVGAPHTLGTPVTGALGAGDCALEDGLVADVIRVKANELQRMQFAVTWSGSTKNGNLRLVDEASGALLAVNGVNDDNGRVSYLWALLPAGRYRLQMVAAEPGHAPGYSIVSQGGSTDVRCENIWTKRGVTTTQQITFTDCWDGIGPFYSDWLRLWLVQGETVDVTMRSTEFDAHLQIWNEVDGELASNENGAGGTDARLVYTAPRTGEYNIRARAGAPGQIGAYTIEIK
ncbi:MAG TPA: hypothetical protein VKA84_03810 [Gemmatimonadaceae bacterium]|nr:hypothetical protein [Gemmatimonadaceae bacterium]